MCARSSIIRGMHSVGSRSFKGSFRLTSFVRNASFSSGWLHLAVQCFFAVITVSSFILILIMAIPSFPTTRPVPERANRCHTKNCMVYCTGVPYFGLYTEDIVFAVLELPDTCTRMRLVLLEAMFINGTLPANWIPRLRMPIHELGIMRGNLRHFTQGAFLNQHVANVRVLALYNLNIRTWSANSFVGLSNLKQLYIRDCIIGHAEEHILRSVDDTLRSLTIIGSKRLWDPANFTGSAPLAQLATVDFSNNTFNDVLGKDSFTGLEGCKMLYLNSCNITAIGAGAFDNLKSIESVFLNDNLLITLPYGLFTNILTFTNATPRISLEDNLWNCDCNEHEIRLLVQKDMLLTDPGCTTPQIMRERTFSELQYFCHKDLPPIGDESPNGTEKENQSFLFVNDICYKGSESSADAALTIMSPIAGYECLPKQINKREIHRMEYNQTNDWIKFTFFLTTAQHTIVQIGAEQGADYGLLWYQSNCPNQVYCVNMVPAALRVYNVDMSANYIFCPVLTSSGAVDTTKCVFYSPSHFLPKTLKNQLQLLLYVSTGGISLLVGALCVYGLVRKYPNLLKGSKRILFVKHKNLEALVLPPKVPARTSLVDDIVPMSEEKIFIVPAEDWMARRSLNRNKSTMSNKSNAPSYISALQPTDEQLAEWRIRNHFTNDLATSELSTSSWMQCDLNPFHYEVTDNDISFDNAK